MFANNKDEARQVYCNLLNDGLISQQKIYIRKYEPLKKLLDGVIPGMPIPNEWRIFVCYGQVVSCSYYWGTYLEDIIEKKLQVDCPFAIDVKRIINRIGDKSNFYSFDMAQKEDGEWTLIEINEGQQSGLNGLGPIEFYKNLKQILDNRQGSR